MSIKVLHINFSDSGGAAVASMTRHEEFLKRGFSSKYLALNLTKNHPKDNQYYSHRRIYKSVFEKTWYLYIKSTFIKNKNTRLLSKIPSGQNEILSTPYSTFDLTKDPLYQEADLIHFHFVANFLDYPSFFKKNKKPIVWTLHDKNPFSGILHCTTDFPRNAHHIESAFIQKKKEWVKNSNITIVSPSNLYKKSSLKSPIFENFNHEVIHHGISDNIFFPIIKEEARKKLNLPSDKKIVISVITETARSLKGISEIIRTAKKMKDIIFILIGENNNKLESVSNIIYTGFVYDKTILNEWYNSADVTISNSEEESFGLSIAESLKTGTPIIMKNTGLFIDIITKKNGLKISSSLFHTINNFYEKSFERKEIIESSKKLNMSVYVDKHVKLYNSIL